MAQPATEPRWRRLPEERPQQITEAALEVFREHGLAGARLEDIARRAGVSKGTIYLYFSSKEELFREVVRSTVVAALDEGERRPRATSATEQLTDFMQGYWEFVRTPAFAVVHRVIVGELHQFPDLLEFYSTEVIMHAHAIIARIIERGVAAGEFRSVDPAVASRVLTSLLSTNALWCNKRKYLPHMRDRTDAQVFRELVDFYLHALRA